MCVCRVSIRSPVGDVLPAYKTDAVVRKSDQDRYDDRLVVKTNLIEAYDALFDFATNHLPDRFALEGGHRVSARDIIARELVSNTLIHREYMSPFPAKLVIDAVSLRTENASRSLYEGRLTLSDFNPIPKNPIIADFFANIGRAEELGSGMRNLNKYCRIYSGIEPVLEGGDVFRARVATTPVQARDADGVDGVLWAIVDQDGYVTSARLAELAGVTTRTAQRRIRRLVEGGQLMLDEKIAAHAYRRS